MNKKYNIGDNLSILNGFYRHHGLYIGNNTVINASKKYGVVLIQTLKDFSEGKIISNHGKKSSEPTHIVINRATALLGQKYDLFSNNCEHFISEVSGLNKTSPQLNLLFGISVFCIGLYYVNKFKLN